MKAAAGSQRLEPESAASFSSEWPGLVLRSGRQAGSSARAATDGNPPGPLFRRTRTVATSRSELQPNAVAMLPRRWVIRFWNGIADNLPAKKMRGLAKCGCTGIAKKHQIFRLQHNNVILLVASDRYLSPRRANKSLERLSARPCGKLRAIQV
jgi:hypothetical protein